MSVKRPWQELRTVLVSILESNNVYYQAPSKEQMRYPAILFERDHMDVERANNKLYAQNNKYKLTYIDPLPTDTVQEKLLKLPYCTHDRHYTSDGLHYDVFTIYF